MSSESRTFTSPVLPDATFTVLCDDNNVQHCPAVAKLADGNFAVSSNLNPDAVAILTADEMDTLLGSGDKIHAL